MSIFQNLPNDIIIKIIKMNTEREKDELYKKRYNTFTAGFIADVRKWKTDILVDDIGRDLLYGQNWKNKTEHELLNIIDSYEFYEMPEAVLDCDVEPFNNLNYV
tara:strand:- start:9440 stop:9751 length:312 start_codon:yes stop_codon:yes gene_type:complete